MVTERKSFMSIVYITAFCPGQVKVKKSGNHMQVSWTPLQMEHFTIPPELPSPVVRRNPSRNMRPPARLFWTQWLDICQAQGWTWSWRVISRFSIIACYIILWSWLLRMKWKFIFGMHVCWIVWTQFDTLIPGYTLTIRQLVDKPKLIQTLRSLDSWSTVRNRHVSVCKSI